MNFIKKHFLGSLCSFGLIFVFCFIVLICFSPEVKASDEIITYTYNGVTYNVQFYWETYREYSVIICDSNGVPAFLLFSNDYSNINYIYYEGSNKLGNRGLSYILRCNYNFNSSTGVYVITWDNGYTETSYPLPNGYFPVYCGSDIKLFDDVSYTANGIYLYANQPLQDNSPTFYLSNTDNTFDFPQILSKPFSSDNYNNYFAYVESDYYGRVEMSKEYSDLNNSFFIFYYDVFMNTDYHITLVDYSTSTIIEYFDITVTNLGFNIVLSNNNTTDEPIIAYTGDFPADSPSGVWSVFYQDSTPTEDSILLGDGSSDYIDFGYEDKEHWVQLPCEDFSSYSMRSSRFWVRIFENDTYYFKFEKYVNENEIEKYIVQVNVTNINRGDFLYGDFLDKPYIFLDFDESSQSYVLRTQDIYMDKALNLKCLITSDSSNFNYDTWEMFDIDFKENDFLHQTDIYFYYKIPVLSAEDKDYRIVFYNYITNTVSEETFYQFRVDSASDYIQNELHYSNNFMFRINNLINWFKDRLGFLFYPFDFISNFVNRVRNLNYLEPIIRIPELHDPFFNNKIFDGIEFNFNSLLENSTFAYIYAIYLVAVDFIFIMALVVYLYACFLMTINS